MVKEVTDSNFEELINSGQPVMVDFWAEWCGPCRMVGPIVDELSNEYTGKMLVGKVNVDDNPEICEKYGIRNIPTILFFKSGELVDKHVGAAPKSAFVGKISNILS
ncbi:MAG: thioredoxin [Candidatus Azobacteroides sp.]|nr:thioredoxin [Candidatus Azobacteroides sp.]